MSTVQHTEIALLS